MVLKLYRHLIFLLNKIDKNNSTVSSFIFFVYGRGGFENFNDIFNNNLFSLSLVVEDEYGR